MINAHFSTGETGALLRACRTSFAHRAVMLEGVKVEPEDIFCEVIEVLDDLMQDASERTQSAVDDVFTQVMYRVREWQGGHAKRQETGGRQRVSHRQKTVVPLLGHPL